MSKSVCPLLMLATCLPWLVGCPHATSVVAIQPRISLDDLVPGLDPADNAYLLLDRTPTIGRFACGLAIAKFEPAAEELKPQLSLRDISSANQARWVEAFQGVAAIRELVFLSGISSENGRQDPEALCVAAQRLGASLLLIYAPNRHGPNTAQELGVLYDAGRRRPIATLHASSHFVNEDGDETPPEDAHGDPRDWDARFQTARAFEKYAHTCLVELITLDSPPPSTQPHDWQKPWPERWWIPKVIKTK